MRRRRGVTLTEVLVAIFVMAIGMVSILALFPVGIQNMTAAATDNRMVFAAHNAEQVAEMHNLRMDEYVVGVPTNPRLRQGSMYFFLSGLGGTANNNWRIGAQGADPSPPMFVDPIGFLFYSDTQVGNVSFPAGTRYAFPPGVRGLPRCRVADAIYGGSQRERWFSVGDDISFNKYGEPAPDFDTPVGSYGAGNPPVRERRYSWTYIWRRPRFSDPLIVDLTVVVFSGRRIGGSGGTPSDELTFGGPNRGGSTAFTRNSTVVTLSWQGAIENGPPIRRGNWLLDATVRTQPTVVGNGYFYRVVDVATPTFVNGEWQQNIEIQTPARADGYVAVMMAHVVDVVEKSNGRAAAPQN